jgi:hypothetical protein
VGVNPRAQGGRDQTDGDDVLNVVVLFHGLFGRLVVVFGKPLFTCQYGAGAPILTSEVIYFMLASFSSVFKKKRKTTEVSKGLFQD